MSDHPQGTAANTILLLLGHPDPTMLAAPQFAEVMQRLASGPDLYKALQYGQEQGSPALIHFLVEKFNRDDQLGISAENVMIVGDSTHAVDMIARLYGKPDGVVLMEAVLPTHLICQRIR
jgi:DNA-binding transcriptional MocR family regulator